MSLVEALRAAHTAGVTVMVDGEGLVLEAIAEPPQAVLDALSRHKLAILGLLRPGRGGWMAEDWHAFFDERAGIVEFDGGLSRAEVSAFDCCVIEWLNQHPAPSPPGRCAWCGTSESRAAVVLPFGTEPGTHAWLHGECWSAWHQARRADAIAALTAMGIRASGFANEDGFYVDEGGAYRKMRSTP